MANAARGVEYLDQARERFDGVIHGDSIDWKRYMTPEERARIVPADAIAERAKKALFLPAEHQPGLTLPWDKATGKVLIRPGALCLWAGWTHHGKTALVKQTMLHAMKEGEKPLIASMEEPIDSVWGDMAKMACGSQEPSMRDVGQFEEFIRGKLWLYDQEGTVQPRRMVAVVRYAAKELGVTQAVVDSLMMLAVGRDDYEAQANFVGELKAAAKDTGCTVHLVAHMRKREGKNGDETPGTIHDIAGGHEIGSKADYVFLPWRDKSQNAQWQCLMKVDKQRGGRFNWIGTVQLKYHETSRQIVEDYFPMRFWQ